MGIFSKGRSYLGIDVGSSSIKAVELKKDGSKVVLLTYGFSENLFDNLGQLKPKQTAGIIKQIIKQSGALSNKAVAALPTFSVFSSIINLSGISKKDLASAVHWEAKKVIPLSLEEMALDWKKIQGSKDNKANIKILLTGAPRALVGKYTEIFKEARVELLSLETETFALIRSLIGNDKSVIMLVEAGANTTDISIVDQGIPMFNRSIDVGGLTISKAISNNLNISLERAEQFKYDLGVSSIDSRTNVVPKTIAETVAPIVNEIKYSLNLFHSKNDKAVEKIILSGGSALLINFSNYLSKIININVIVGNPWSKITFPLELKPLLEEIGPRMSIAIGLALREIE
jgi:type IV pilus assembly protein PilM